MYVLLLRRNSSLCVNESYLFFLVFMVHPFLLFFFFQAEDGIRDVAVTGVQTCALPISSGRSVPRGADRPSSRGGFPVHLVHHLATMADLHRAGRYDRMSDDVLTLTGQGDRKSVV